MNVLHGLFICFVSAKLCGFVDANDVTGDEGRGITVRCHFSTCIGTALFCKESCERKDGILIETKAGTVYKGRYTIEYQGSSSSCGVFVTIHQLIRSDAGRYTCRVQSWYGVINQDINLTVKVAPTTTASTSTTSPLAVSETTPQAADYLLPLILSVPLVIVLVAVLLLIYKKKTQRNIDGLNTSVNLDDQNEMTESYEDCLDPRHEDSLYQSLSPASRDQDQIYCTLTKSI